MRLSNLLSEETITISMSHKDKQGLIEELLDLAMKAGKITDRTAALKAVIDRENLMSTGLERGIAVPHAKSPAVSDLTMSMGISREGIDFQAADGKPSHLFFFLLAPEAAAGPNVQILAQIARLTNDPAFCQVLKNASTPKEVLEIIQDVE